MGKSSRRKQQGEVLDRAVPGPSAKTKGGPDTPGLLMKTYFHLFLIAAVGLLAYSNTFHVPFILDDIPQIPGNPMIRSLNNFLLALRGHHFSDTAGYVYVPSRIVGYFSFALNYYFGGLDVAGYHFANLVIHIANAVLVYFFVILTFMTPGMQPYPAALKQPAAGTGSWDPRLIAFFTALLFVSHPVQTQAVTYIIQRFASLAAMFYLLSVVMYVKARLVMENERGLRQEAMGEGQGGEKKSVLPIAYRLLPVAYFLFSLLSAVLAMKTKEIAFTLPIVIVLYEVLFFPAALRKKLVFLIPALSTIVIIPLSMVSVKKPISRIFSDLMGRARLGTEIPRVDYLITQMRVITTYIRLLFVPVRQNIDYDYPVYHSFFTPSVFLSAVFLLFVFGTGLYCLYRSRALLREPSAGSGLHMPAVYRLAGFGILWFFITLSVESSVIPIADVIFEHRVYLPSVGAFSAITAALWGALGRLKSYERGKDKLIIVSFSVIILVLSATTFARNAIWRDPVTLWEDAAKKSPDKTRPHYNLADAYLAEGRTAEYLHEYETAVNIRPDDAEAHYNLGSAYSKQKRFTEAERELKEAIRIQPDYAHAHNNLGGVYSNTGRPDEAVREFLTAISLSPDYADAHSNLGGEYFKQGHVDDAIREYGTAIRIDPYFADAHYNLGAVYSKQGNDEEAIGEFERAENIRPDDADVHFQLGTLYAKRRQFGPAVNEFRSAVRIRPDYIDAHNNLGYAYYMTGDIDGAIGEFQTILSVKPGDEDARRSLESLGKLKIRKQDVK